MAFTVWRIPDGLPRHSEPSHPTTETSDRSQSPHPTHFSTMPNPYLPAELLDHVVDLLHDTEDALRSCCLVSKSWIPRTRRHLFADIEFYTAETCNHGKTRFQILPPLLRVTPHICSLDSPWVLRPQMQKRVVGFPPFLALCPFRSGIAAETANESLAPFHGFSPALKSLRLTYDAFQPHTFSTSSVHSLFSRTSL
jgi:hypothetical protein